MKLFQILIIFISLGLYAQTSKVGTVDVDFILSNMPEMATVKTQVDNYTKEIESEFNAKLKKLQSDIENYKAEQASLTINQRKAKEDSIIALENEVNKFQQNGNQLIVLKQEEVLQPLYKKIGEALEKVAQAQEYSQVLLRNDQVVFVDNRFDLTLSVLKELGIELKEEE